MDAARYAAGGRRHLRCWDLAMPHGCVKWLVLPLLVVSDKLGSELFYGETSKNVPIGPGYEK